MLSLYDAVHFTLIFNEIFIASVEEHCAYKSTFLENYGCERCLTQLRAFEITRRITFYGLRMPNCMMMMMMMMIIIIIIISRTVVTTDLRHP